MSKKSTQTKQKEIVDEILRSLRRILKKTDEYSRRLMSDTGLSLPQILCLKAIAEHVGDEPITAVQINQQVQLSLPTTSRILDRLEKLDLIHRERSKSDRRKFYVSITPQGKKKNDQLPTILQDEFRKRLHKITQQEREQILNSLELIVNFMDAADLDAAPLLDPRTIMKPPQDQ